MTTEGAGEMHQVTHFLDNGKEEGDALGEARNRGGRRNELGDASLWTMARRREMRWEMQETEGAGEMHWMTHLWIMARSDSDDDSNDSTSDREDKRINRRRIHQVSNDSVAGSEEYDNEADDNEEDDSENDGEYEGV